jgi:hypothetical protein
MTFSTPQALEAFISKAKKEFAGKGKDLKGELLERSWNNSIGQSIIASKGAAAVHG